MARRYKPGDVKWVAYPDGVVRVVIVERGCRGFVFRDGRKPENPYTVSEDGADNYVLGEAQLHDNPVEASVSVARMRSKLGLDELEDEDEEDDEDLDDDELEENDFDDEDDEEFDDEDELEED